MQTQNVPAPLVPRPGQLFALNQPRYATENWKMILGLFDPHDPHNARIRHIQIFNRVASIRQQKILIRTPINLPNGFYELTTTGELAYAGPCDEDIRNPFTKDAPFSERIARESIAKLLGWVNWRREEHEEPEKCVLVFDQPGIYDEASSKFTFQFKSLVRPGGTVQLPIVGDPLFVKAFHLRLALTEVTRYDTVVIAYERSPDELRPIFIGRSWSECAVVMPQPPYLKHTRLHG